MQGTAQLDCFVERAVMLVIGRKEQWTGPSGESRNEECHFIDFRLLGPDLLAKLRPATVVSTLFGEGFDAIDVAKRLCQSGFVGRYRAVAGALPNPAMVQREIRMAAPGIDFEILSMPKGAVTIH